MAVRTVNAFLDLLKKSQLLSDAQLLALRDDVPQRQDSPLGLATTLVRRKVISRWQAEQLLAGRCQFTLGGYRVIQHVGKGGMGKVYLAEADATGDQYAIKILSKKSLGNPEIVARFQREVQVAMALDHPNIVRAIASGNIRGQHFLVMEFVNGRNLNEWLDEYHQLPIEWACECIQQVAYALQYAHESGLVHRDIKPSNILVLDNPMDGPPQVKLTDMGLARMGQAADSDELTQTGEIVGTVDYIAPEQAQNTKDADIRADIFSLGCTLFKLLAGRVPYEGDTTVERLTARISGAAPSIADFRDDVPDQLTRIIACMLDRDRERRFQTPAEVANALNRYTASSPDGWKEESTLRLPIPSDAEKQLAPAEDIAVRDFFADVALNENLHHAQRSRQARKLTAAISVSVAIASGFIWYFFSTSLFAYWQTWMEYFESLGNP
ncbi:MAG: hypothetical protein CL681_25770 [Blastopirellula sp.]|nr:hypothetical protein [Blastopirellula sp.]